MEYEIKPARGFRLDLHELWNYRELVYYFTLRDIQVKYKQTVLGVLWAILQPFLLMIVFTFFFSRQLRFGGEMMHGLPYPLFAYSGLMIWTMFANGLNNSGQSMINNANIIRKIYFPRLIIPLSTVIGTLADFAMTLILFGGLLFYYDVKPDYLSMLLVLPLSIAISFITVLGAGSLLSALNVKYRDFRYIIPFLIQVLLFITPVIYPTGILPEGIIGDVLALNPIAGAIELFRASIAGEALDGMLLAKSFLIAVVLLLAGVIYFRKTEYYFADIA